MNSISSFYKGICQGSGKLSDLIRTVHEGVASEIKLKPGDSDPKTSALFFCNTLFSKDVVSATYPLLWLHIFRVTILQKSDCEVPGHSQCHQYGVAPKNWCCDYSVPTPFLDHLARDPSNIGASLLLSPLPQGWFLAFSSSWLLPLGPPGCHPGPSCPASTGLCAHLACCSPFLRFASWLCH